VRRHIDVRDERSSVGVDDVDAHDSDDPDRVRPGIDEVLLNQRQVTQVRQ
jgi:hypothetical protein